MTKQICSFFAFFILVTSSCLFSQEKPRESDSKEYKEAYELLFDSQKRAKRALDLLTESGTKALADLPDQELLLTYYAYNELYIPEKQLEVAKLLFERNPKSSSATSCMCNSLHFKLDSPEGIKEVEKFVEDTMKKGLGNRRSLLLLKANVVLVKPDLPDGKKRVEVTDLLVEAYVADPVAKDEINFSIGEPTNFIVEEYPFVSFFSQSERRAIQERMLKAKKEKDESEKETGKVDAP